MSYCNSIAPEPRTTEAAVALGESIRTEYGRYGLHAYLSMLADLFPREWIEEVARRLEQPCPPRRMPEGDRMPPPPEPRPKKPDMEKLLQVMQVVGNLK